MVDGAGNELESYEMLRLIENSKIDTMPPAITSASMYVSDEIVVEFSEAIYGMMEKDPWTVSRSVPAGLVAESVVGTNGTRTITIHLSGNQSNTTPSITLAYDPESGTMTDAAANPLGQTSHGVADGLPPQGCLCTYHLGYAH